MKLNKKPKIFLVIVTAISLAFFAHVYLGSIGPTCPEGEIVDPMTMDCVKYERIIEEEATVTPTIIAVTPSTLHVCPVGYTEDENGLCIKPETLYTTQTIRITQEPVPEFVDLWIVFIVLGLTLVPVLIYRHRKR